MRKKKTCFSSSLLCPKMVNLSSAASLLRPSLLHLRFSNTSSMGIFSYNHRVRKEPLHKTKHNRETEPSKKCLKFLRSIYQINGFLQHRVQYFRLLLRHLCLLPLVTALQKHSFKDQEDPFKEPQRKKGRKKQKLGKRLMKLITFGGN